MLLVTLTYLKPLTEIDALMDAHVAFLQTQFAKGTFVAAGRQLPREGGIILARNLTKPALTTLMQQDPFVTAGAASFVVTEFRTSLHHADFKAVADAGTRTVGTRA